MLSFHHAARPLVVTLRVSSSSSRPSAPSAIRAFGSSRLYFSTGKHFQHASFSSLQTAPATSTIAPSSSSSSSSSMKRPSLAMGPRQKTALPVEAKKSDLVVVLDMDECLIHSKFHSGSSSSLAHQLISSKNNNNSNNDANGNNESSNPWNQEDDNQEVETFDVRLPDGDYVKVHERPFLHDFLKQVSERFETHVFTAAMEVYAKPVLDTLDPLNNRFTKRWYRDSCVRTKDGAYVKNLGVLQKNEARIVLVDNNPLSFLANPSNGILVSSFYTDATDQTLLAVLRLLEEIDEHPDVRPVLDQRFGLKNALEEASKNGL